MDIWSKLENSGITATDMLPILLSLIFQILRLIFTRSLIVAHMP